MDIMQHYCFIIQCAIIETYIELVSCFAPIIIITILIITFFMWV